MNKVHFELNLAGLNELMKSAEMQSILSSAGEAVAAQAGSGDYGSRVHIASFCAICNVYPDSAEAARENYRDNTLLRALHNAGLPMSKR